MLDVQLVDSFVRQLKLVKAHGIDNLTAEHLIHSHPALISILVKLFNIMIFVATFQPVLVVVIQYLFLMSPSFVYC